MSNKIKIAGALEIIAYIYAIISLLFYGGVRIWCALSGHIAYARISIFLQLVLLLLGSAAYLAIRSKIGRGIAVLAVLTMLHYYPYAAGIYLLILILLTSILHIKKYRVKATIPTVLVLICFAGFHFVSSIPDNSFITHTVKERLLNPSETYCVECTESFTFNQWRRSEYHFEKNERYAVGPLSVKNTEDGLWRSAFGVPTTKQGILILSSGTETRPEEAQWLSDTVCVINGVRYTVNP